MPALLHWVEKENLPEYLGGTSKATLLDDVGPWQDPRLIAEIKAEWALLTGTKDIKEEGEGEAFGSGMPYACCEDRVSQMGGDAQTHTILWADIHALRASVEGCNHLQQDKSTYLFRPCTATPPPATG